MGSPKDRADNRRQRKTGRKVSHEPLLRTVEPTFVKRPQPARTIVLKPLTAAQAHYDNSIAVNTLTFGVGPAGTGKAQPLDAAVKVPGGWSQMRDMQVGTKIVTASGEVSEVVSVHPQGEKQIYRIVFEDGRQTECCDEHLWRVYRYDWQPVETRWRVIELSEIRRLLAMRSASNRLYIELSQPEARADADLPMNPYLLGLLIGDGHFGRTDLRLSTADDFIIEQVVALLPAGMTVRHIKDYDYGLVRENVLGSNGNPLMSIARDLDLHNSRCDDKRIPPLYMNASPAQRLALLQGLMDTDGTVCKTGSTSFCSVSEGLALDVQELVRSLGGLASISVKKTGHKPAYNVRIRVSEPRSLFRLPRKREKLSETYQYADLKLRIVSVEAVGFKEAQCISIAHESHLYVTDDYTVTHNTWWAAMRAAEKLKAGEIEGIVVTRPAKEAGEELGFLPGLLEEKYEPYFRPVRDALVESFGSGHLEYLIKAGVIEARPLALLRGATLKNVWVIGDEMQNATKTQMKMFLTRIGEGAKFIVNGDPDQCDLDDLSKSGLIDAVTRLGAIRTVGVTKFTDADIVRSGLCQEIVRAYDEKRQRPLSERYDESDSTEGLERTLRVA